MFGRSLKSKLDLVKPNINCHVENKQCYQQFSHKSNSPVRSFSVGEKIYYRNFSGSPKWLPGIVKKCLGTVNYSIEVPGGIVIRRHIEHIRR